MRQLIKACLFVAALLSSHAYATGPSEALLLPQNGEWQRSLVPVFPKRSNSASQESTAPFIEQLEIGMPGKGRVVGKVVFDRPADFNAPTLNLYFDLDNNTQTGRPSGVHQGVDLMLSVQNNKVNAVFYNADGSPGIGHFRSHVEGNVFWFTFQVPETMSLEAIRAYALSSQKDVRNDNTVRTAVTKLKDGGLTIEPLFKAPPFNFSAPSADNVPASAREALAISPGDGEAKVLYEDRINGSNEGSSPLVQRVSAMHLGGSRLFLQIDTDRDLATTGEHLVIYLDTDNNPDTGRSDASHKGVDLMMAIGNNGTVVSSRSNELTPQLVKARARQVGSSIYLVLDAPQMNLDKKDAVDMTGYVVSQGKGKRGSQTSRLAIDLPVQKKAVRPLPAVEADVLNSAGYRYLQNRVAYESLENKGNLRSDIALTGYQPVREAPLPGFMGESPAEAKAAAVTQHRVPVTVEEDAGIAREDAVVRFGFPLPKGEVFSVADIAVAGADGAVLPAQVQATALWPDGSFRWLVVQVRDDFAASEAKTYEVLLAKDAAAAVPARGAIEVVEQQGRMLVFTGALRAAVDVEHFRGLDFVEILQGSDWKQAARAQDGFVIVDEQGTAYSSANARPRSVSLEEQTSERVTIRIAGDYASADGKPYMSYVCRLTFYVASARVDMAFTHINSRLDSEFSDFRSLDYALTLSSPIDRAQVLTFGENETPFVVEAETVLVRQMTDKDAELVLSEKSEPAYRLPGALRLQTKEGFSVALAVTDFWQRWPKGIRAEGESLRLELLPTQPSADFGKDLPYYLMYPFVEGFYRLKWGMAFTERVSLDFAGKGEVSALWAEAQQPLIAVVPAQWFVQTQALIPLAEPDGNQFALWDEYISGSVDEHLKVKDAQREYGFLNYGDWFGERGRNWGNNEYDLPHTLFSQFARTGDRRFYRAALSGARHQADSDIVHAYPDPYYVGANHEHSIGHTGQWSQNFTNATWSYVYDLHTAAGNGHTWTDGMIDAWVIGVDPVVMEAALKLGDHITYAFAPSFTYLGSHERSAGWSLRALMAMYRGTGDPVYLEAAGRIGEIALKEQDKEKTGVWPHELPRDHAGGRVGIHGNNSFLMGILISGLASYHTETGDPRYAESIAAAGRWLKEGWDGQSGGWPYSIAVDGSPAGRSMPALNPLIYGALLYGALMNDDAEGIAYAEDAMTATFGGSDAEAFGKNISLKGFFTPESLGLLQRYYREQAQKNGGSASFAALSNEPEARQKYFQGIPLAEDFAVRAPDLKEFRVQSKGPASVKLDRSRFGSMPKPRLSGNITVVGADGKTVFEKTFSTMEDLNFDVAIPAAGEWRILIDDERNAVWSASSEQARVASRLVPGYNIGGVARKRLSFDVPEGTQSFTLRVIGIHQGNYGAAIFNPAGAVRADVTGENRTIHLLGSDINFDDIAHRSAVADITIDVTAADKTGSGPWSLILWAQGDIGIQLSGIPPYVFID